MSEKDKFGVRGDVTIILRDKDGNIKERQEVRNLIVNVGYDFICDVIGNTTQPGDMHWTTIGTGAVAADPTDTTLGSDLVRVTNTYAHTPGQKDFTMTADYAAGVGDGAIAESGLLNAASAGTLLNRVTFAVITKGLSDTLQIVWTITLSAAAP